MLNLLPDDKSPNAILDVGCGTGRLLRRAHERWPSAQVVGVDPAEGMATIARRNLPEATIHVAVAEALPLSDGSVDVAFSAVSLHHWRDQVLGVRELARVVRAPGLVCVADIVLPSWVGSMLGSRARSRSTLQALFHQVGFTLLTHRSMFLNTIHVILARRAPAGSGCLTSAWSRPDASHGLMDTLTPAVPMKVREEGQRN